MGTSATVEGRVPRRLRARSRRRHMAPRFSQHKLTVYRVQTMHHRSLYLEHLPFAIKERYKDVGGLSQLERELFVDTSLAWELGEIEMVGYVGLYHRWEQYSKDFVSIVLGERPTQWRRQVGGRKPYPDIVAFHLAAMGLNPSPEVLSTLGGANAVVNAYKHGDAALDRLAKSQPEYFVDVSRPESFHIPDGKLEAFFDAVDRFWVEIEAGVDLEFSFP